MSVSITLALYETPKYLSLPVFVVCLQVMVVVKYLFQFGFFPWNSVYETKLNEDKPFFPPRILGLEKTDNYIRYDLLQLLALFFHRSLLQVCRVHGPLRLMAC